MKKMEAKDELANYANTVLLTSFFFFHGYGFGGKYKHWIVEDLLAFFFFCNVLHMSEMEMYKGKSQYLDIASPCPEQTGYLSSVTSSASAEILDPYT